MAWKKIRDKEGETEMESWRNGEILVIVETAPRQEFERNDNAEFMPYISYVSTPQGSSLLKRHVRRENAKKSALEYMKKNK